MTESRYRTLEVLGEGGMGQVASVHDLNLDRQVALKSLRSRLLEDDESRQRFQLEAQSAGRFEHPNIPAVYEYGLLKDGTPYYTMRLIQGDTLTSLIERLRSGKEQLSFTRRLQLVQQIAEALQYAHSLGVLHRDIKPDNVMVGRFGEVQVVDWGICLQMKQSVRQTEPGSFVGTTMYAAPESLQGETQDVRTDIYSLGVLLYELFTLHPAFEGKSAADVMVKVLTKRPRAPESFIDPAEGRVPREISKLILKAMARDPEARFSTMAELNLAMQQVVEGDAPIVCPHTAYKRSLNALSRFLDNHNSPLVVAFVYLWTLLPLIWLGQFLYFKFLA